MRLPARLACALALVAASTPALAQRVDVEARTDSRVRGLSWSGGRASVAGTLAVPLGDLSLEARGQALRGSRRHGGADLGIDLAARYFRSLGSSGWRAQAGVVHHSFIDRARLNFIELEGGAGYLIGPLDLSLTAAWAPPQDSTGGQNLYLRAGASAGVPATPFTLYGHLGHSMGDDGRARATRLRPTGDYTDWRLGVERVQGPVALGLELTGTSIDTPVAPTAFTDRHVGTRLAGIARLSL